MSNPSDCLRFSLTRHIAALLAGAAMVLAVALSLAPKVSAATCSAANDADLAVALSTPTCTTINVAAGNYTGPVTLSHAVVLNGANVGINPNTDTRGSESIMSSASGGVVINITAPDVVVDGFTVTHSSDAAGGNDAFGIEMQVSAAGTIIANNIINDIATDGTFGSTAQAIYLVNGPDGVKIVKNLIENVSGSGSTKGVFIGDSTSADSSNVVIIDQNVIRNITSIAKGAYGVTLNNGSSPVGGSRNSGLVVTNNTISGLNGHWVHAIGIEGDAPNAIISANSFGDFNSNGNPDNVAVWFENEDPSYASTMVNGNIFNFDTNAGVFGIAVGFGSGGSVDGTCNYWGSATGPSGTGTGKGALVSPLVTFSPWNKTAKGPCAPK
jgi:hypothetical protein